ncbi:hypothetical protein LCGC14_2356190 [marine sediment metagenome]|uniref:Uncharacterized protein n=1 Tax=marine sediment metagenome TaxID=412755 RepID=A0A0F9EKH7_9ZZZZ
MTCKTISAKARAEQDYWLTYNKEELASEEQRLEFLRYDSHSDFISETNPILVGKKWHGRQGEAYRDSYFSLDGGWIGGLHLYDYYLHRSSERGIKSLREWFGEEIVQQWKDTHTREVARGWINPYREGE